MSVLFSANDDESTRMNTNPGCVPKFHLINMSNTDGEDRKIEWGQSGEREKGSRDIVIVQGMNDV